MSTILHNLAVKVLQDHPGWKCELVKYDHIFISPDNQRYRLVHLSDPFMKHASELQMISEDCFPAKRSGLVKVCL